MASKSSKTPSALDLLAAPEWDGNSPLTITVHHLTRRDAGFGDFIILHGTNDTPDAVAPFVAVKVVGAVLTNNFMALANGSPKNLLNRTFTMVPMEKKVSRSTRDKDGNPAEYKNFVVVEGDGTETPSVEDIDW